MSDENLELLLVEDNQDDAFFFERAVRRAASGELKLSCVDTLREAIERSGDGHVDVVFLDLSLPDSNGLDTFLTLHERYPDLPVVVLTGNDDERLAAEATQGRSPILPILVGAAAEPWSERRCTFCSDR